MGLLEINSGTKFEFSIKKKFKRDLSYPNIRINISIINKYINYSYRTEYFEEEINGLFKFLEESLYSNELLQNSYLLKSSNIKFKSCFKGLNNDKNKIKYNGNLRMYIYLNIPLDTKNHFEKYLIKLCASEVMIFYKRLHKEYTKLENNSSDLKSPNNEKTYLCAIASYSKNGKEYTFLVDEMKPYQNWKIEGSNRKVYFKRFKIIEESKLNFSPLLFKKIVPIEDENIIIQDLQPICLISLDDEKSTYIYDLILEHEEEIINKSYKLKSLNDFELKFFDEFLTRLEICLSKVKNNENYKDEIQNLQITANQLNIYIFIAMRNVYKDVKIKSLLSCLFDLIAKDKLILILKENYNSFMNYISNMYLLTLDNLYYNALVKYNNGCVCDSLILKWNDLNI